MRAVRRTPDEQYELIMECRTSGLSDYQWCTDHGINPGTFYNWVKRLRKKACYDIPPAAMYARSALPETQEVVKLEILPELSEAGMIIYSMIETAKANGVDPLKYLTYLLEHRPDIDMQDNELATFAPWHKNVQAVCKNKQSKTLAKLAF